MRHTNDINFFHEEQFFGKLSSSLVTRFNLDTKHASELTYEIIEMLQNSESNFEELNLMYLN